MQALAEASARNSSVLAPAASSTSLTQHMFVQEVQRFILFGRLKKWWNMQLQGLLRERLRISVFSVFRGSKRVQKFYFVEHGALYAHALKQKRQQIATELIKTQQQHFHVIAQHASWQDDAVARVPYAHMFDDEFAQIYAAHFEQANYRAQQADEVAQEEGAE